MSRIRNALLFHLAVRLGPALIRLMGRTWRVRFVDHENVQACWGRGKPVIYTFWHGRLLPLTFTHRDQDIQILISRHRDGEIIRRVTGSLGFGAVRGSTGKGGARAILEMVKLGRGGRNLAITPDGPKGPRGRAQAGVVRISQKAGLPIIPMASSASRGWVLRSWDRFRIPAPFARVVICFGSPIEIPASLDPDRLEEYRITIEKGIQAETARADKMSGVRETT